MTDLADTMVDLAHRASAETRDCAAKMVNAVIIIAEQHGQDAVSLEIMRQLADAIATMAIVTRQQNSSTGDAK